MLTVLYLILMLGVLIFVHELGHFIAAKTIGVYVSEFALGMGPKIFSFKRKKHPKDPTVYSLRLFPIGGFCAMAGEVGEDEKGLKKNQFMCNRSKWERTVILLAGVTMNILLAIVLLFLQSLIFGTTDQRSIVGNVPKGYPVDKAGIEVGDRIKEVNGYRVNTWDKMTIVLNLKNKSNVYKFVVEKKDGSTKTYEITPVNQKNDDGTTTKVFGIGASQTVEKGFFHALKYAFSKLGSTVCSMWIIIVELFAGKLSLNALSGPVGMYTVVGQSVSYGWNSIIYLTAYLSVNLAVINALPFPAFDGGRVLFVIIEAITKKKVNPNVENTIHTIGFILLMILMLYITIQDVIKLT